MRNYLLIVFIPAFSLSDYKEHDMDKPAYNPSPVVTAENNQPNRYL